MKLYKYSTEKATVTEVEGEPWPGCDEDGEVCYENSHFKTPQEAWECMVRESVAFIKIAAMDVERARNRLRDAEQKSADAVIEFRDVNAAYERFIESNASHQGRREATSGA